MALKRGIRAGQIGNAIKLPIVGRAHCLMPAGRVNKTKLMHGKQTVGNRFVVIRFPNEAAYMKAQSDGVKAWLDKYAPESREILAQSWETK